MSRLLSAAVLALSLAANTAALAQSYTAPAGIPAATAPGGSAVAGSGRTWTDDAATAYDRLTTGSVTHNSRAPTARR